MVQVGNIAEIKTIKTGIIFVEILEISEVIETVEATRVRCRVFKGKWLNKSEYDSVEFTYEDVLSIYSKKINRR